MDSESQKFCFPCLVGNLGNTLEIQGIPWESAFSPLLLHPSRRWILWIRYGFWIPKNSNSSQMLLLTWKFQSVTYFFFDQ